ncbi:MAG: lamin tail domain-containing protein [bacterium]
MVKEFRHTGLILLLTGILFLSACGAGDPGKARDGSGKLAVNEIMAEDADGGPDWIELYAIGQEPVYLGDYSLADDNPGRKPEPLPDIVLKPGEFIVVQATEQEPGDGSISVPFKLGSDDSVSLYYLNAEVVDELDWKAGDVPAGSSYGRLPDGTGAARTLTPTPNTVNRAAEDSPAEVVPKPSLVINEIVAADAGGGPDWIELYVLGEDSVHLNDYALIDDSTDREHAFLPDITLQPGEFFIVLATDQEPEDGSFSVPFKLGSDDCVSLYYQDTNIIDVLDWGAGDAPSGASYGRLPDGTGKPRTLTPTPGGVNSGGGS